MKEILSKHYDILQEIASGIGNGTFFQLDLEDILLNLDTTERIWVLGAGKAAAAMAKEVEKYFGDRICDGIIIAPEADRELKYIQCFKGSHPYPDAHSVASSYELISLAKKIPAGDTVIFCLSGGASSLYCIPAGEIELEELQESYKLLLNAGVNIHQVNTVRKHLSLTAGGKTAEVLADCRLYSIIVSDVPGDNPQSIGSAPTIGDKTNFTDAHRILVDAGIWEKLPASVKHHFIKGMEEEPDAFVVPKWENHKVEVISGARTLANNIAGKLDELGYKIRIADDAYDEDIKKVSKQICSDGIAVLSRDQLIQKPAALIYFGESTVDVKGDGKGGRNQELALNVAISIEGQHNISLLSMGTDGMDGPTDAAGAIINSETALLARKMKLDPEEYLQNNNSYYFHQQMNNLIKTGPTGSNLMDIQVMLIE